MIETERLILRPMRADDVEDLLHVFTDPRVMASFNSPLFDQQQMERWVQRNLDHQKEHGYGLFSIILKDENRLIGDCGLEWMELNGVIEVELGYDLRSDYWGRGLATEAATAVRDYALTVLQLPRLVSLIRQDNVRSQRVSAKIGMRPSAELTLSGQRYWIYALTRDQIITP